MNNQTQLKVSTNALTSVQCGGCGQRGMSCTCLFARIGGTLALALTAFTIAIGSGCGTTPDTTSERAERASNEETVDLEAMADRLGCDSEQLVLVQDECGDGSGGLVEGSECEWYECAEQEDYDPVVPGKRMGAYADELDCDAHEQVVSVTDTCPQASDDSMRCSWFECREAE